MNEWVNKWIVYSQSDSIQYKAKVQNPYSAVIKCSQYTSTCNCYEQS